jgi:hypothetical protein
MISALPNASFGLHGAFAADAPSSWCLRLRYTGEIVIDGDEFTQGISTWASPGVAPLLAT